MTISLYRYRGFIWYRAVADIRNRYAGTGIGIVWNLIHPLALIVTYSLVFSTIMAARIDNMQGKLLPYVVYLCSGLFPWLALNESISAGCISFVANANYLRKLPVPEQVFVASSAMSATLTLVINFALLLCIAIPLHFTPTIYWLLLPLPLIALQALGFSIGLLLGTLNVFFRDIAQWTTVTLQIAMWTVPIVYAAKILPPWVLSVLAWHPVMPAIETVRALLMYSRLPPAHDWVGMFAWPIALGVIADLVLRKLRAEIRDLV
jgi:ABC-type polysaccharide/polyol phosphate export permease